MSNKFTEFPSGLLTDYDFFITEARFGRDMRYNNGQDVLLFLKGKAFKDGVLVSDEHEERYKLPPGWESNDDGATVQHNANAENFNRASQVAKLCMKVAEIAPEVVDYWVDQGYSPQESYIWLNLGFHMYEETTGEAPYKSTKNWPVAYLGTTQSTESQDNPQAVNNGSEAAVMEQLRELAKNHDSHESFVNSAIEIPGISQYSSLVKRIADPDDLYAELRA